MCAISSVAYADEFTARFYPFSSNGLPECHTKTTGTDTAGSFAAAGMMGAEGFTGYMPANSCAHSAPPQLDWEDTLVSSCATQTVAAGYPSSIWPGGCNPGGMPAALNAFFTGQYSNPHWVTNVWESTNLANPALDSSRTAALNVIIGGLQSPSLRSPAVIPMFGQGDHWVTVVEIDASAGIPGANTGGTWDINYVTYYDGGPATSGAHDGGFNPFPGSGLQMYGGSTFTSIYYRVISNIRPHCASDPLCTSDPFYNKWVMLYEPPASANLPQISANFLRAPGVAHTMNEQLAQSLVWQSLSLARIPANALVWGKIKDGVPSTASLVRAVFPSGAPWNYYLVPIMENARSGNAIALVQLDAEDGSFQGIHVLSAPAPFNSVTRTDAADIARGTLSAGERLGTGGLTWNPASNTTLNKAASQPYFEFRVLSAANTDAGVVRVMLDTGAVERSSH
ncbi:MAG TPA: hypothetical protein VLM79_15645 [Kofleriaceae bacterium]|nr:hypothetical protein [Kofleriaceae bacterium]